MTGSIQAEFGNNKTVRCWKLRWKTELRSFTVFPAIFCFFPPPAIKPYLYTLKPFLPLLFITLIYSNLWLLLMGLGLREHLFYKYGTDILKSCCYQQKLEFGFRSSFLIKPLYWLYTVASGTAQNFLYPPPHVQHPGWDAPTSGS